ncbi:tumor-associated calcium signal transducer 2 [Heterocephalus glaber]|uniref:Tumor-associated calcium signal transducer 2 n=1 Tax=Heterocephalus glaber TaxID=10181 RepID=A0AAX6QBI3_HETGA|nr:tumor-associated calcium signal transducer 2 [Heterocephalus glaber]
MARPPGLAPLLALLALAAATRPAGAQHNCTCATNKMSVCGPDGPGGSCQCRALGSGVLLDCSTLTAKCLLLQARARAPPRGRSLVSPGPLAIVDNDGLYDPECDGEGRFKARQCNRTSVCWCVNSVGVRRTDKGDRGLRCAGVVRTHHILIHLRHGPAAALNLSFLDAELRQLFRQRYGLRAAFLHAVRYDAPTIQIELLQNASQKAPGDVDIGDAAYYFERDVKGESLFPGHSGAGVPVRGGSLPVDHTLIYYLDEKPPEFTMRRLTAGVIAIIVVVAVALVPGVVVMVITHYKRSRKYKKVEIKELGELRSEPSL